MQVHFSRKFQKQVESCNDKRITKRVLSIIEQVMSASDLIGFNGLKKLTGTKNSYRIRLGNYRIGIILEDNNVTFAAFDHRSDIYKYFP